MKLLVLSIDAMFSEDVDKLRKYPKIAPFLERALISKNMAPIYPALTYPCHVSIVSGNTPEKHDIGLPGIQDNNNQCRRTAFN